MTSILDDLVQGKKLPVMFIGSGISKRYINNPDWETLLINVYDFMGKSESDFRILRSKVKNNQSNRMIGDAELNALVAEEMEKEFNEYFYHSELAEKFYHWIKEDYNPFRKCISHILSKLDIVKEKNEEVQRFKELKDKVISVYTTNYDTLIEDLFELSKSSTFIGQSQLFNSNSYELSELFKIHGCITEPDNIIITKSDYDNFRENAKLFSAKLLTIISEYPVVFIGYNLDDPNIQQILSDLVRCLTSEQIDNLNSHFYLIEYKEGEERLIEREVLFKAKSYNGEQTMFPISVISTDNFMKVYEKLSNLTPSMNLGTVKQVKRIVHDIVLKSVENTEADDIIAISTDDIAKLTDPNQRFAIALGYAEDIHNTYGYRERPVEDIIEDVLFDNKNLDNRRLVMETFENSYFRIERILPIYKYLKGIDEEDLDRCPRVKKYINKRSRKKDYLNNGIIKSLDSIASGASIEDIPAVDIGNPRREFLWIIKNIDFIPIDEIRDYLKNKFTSYESMTGNNKSDYRRLVSLYDLYKYK